MERNFYVDDFVKSATTEKETIKVFEQLKQSLRKEGFNLTKWFNNSINMTESFDIAEETEKAKKTFEAKPSAAVLLGFQWNMVDDRLEV